VLQVRAVCQAGRECGSRLSSQHSATRNSRSARGACSWTRCTRSCGSATLRTTAPSCTPSCWAVSWRQSRRPVQPFSSMKRGIARNRSALSETTSQQQQQEGAKERKWQSFTKPRALKEEVDEAGGGSVGASPRICQI